MDSSTTPTFIRSPTPCALADESAEYFREAPMPDPDEPAEYFREATMPDNDEPAEFFRSAPMPDNDEPAEFFRPSALDEVEAAAPSIDENQPEEHFRPIDYNILSVPQFSPAQAQFGQCFNLSQQQQQQVTEQSPFQPSRPLNALLHPMQTPVPMSNPQMAQMGFSDPQDADVDYLFKWTPLIGYDEKSVEARLVQAMTGVQVPSGEYGYNTQSQVQGHRQGCPNCWCPR